MWQPIGLGSQTREPDLLASRAERIKRSKEILFRALNTHTAVAFIGSGCSAPLGYPTWRELALKAVRKTRGALRAKPGGAGASPRDQQLANFERQLRNKKSPATSQQLSFMLGVCQRVLQSEKGQAAYHDFLKETFRRRPPKPGAPNPYRALLDLPIYRFITSNYDAETEAALCAARHIHEDEFKLRDEPSFSRRRHMAFTQQPRHNDQLALFALSRIDAANNMVFHCHGHYEEPDSMIVTEGDYQRWYLSERPDANAFRQTVELLFSSNPILFVGFSLSDEDLMRTLRMITANRTDSYTRRPLFALLPEAAPGADGDAHDFLFERYGVNVIPFLSPDVANRGQDLVNELVGVREELLKWWDSFLQKPKIRRVNVPVDEDDPKPYHHFPIRQEEDRTFGGKRLDGLLDRLHQEALAGRKVLVLTGRGGSGKSWCAQKMMSRLSEGSAFERLFFWSSYYANDALSGLDRALLYLDPEQECKGSRLERFAECLKRGKYFLVFDGIERFMSETENPDSGVGVSPDAKRFLKSVRDPGSRSTVVLTSRLWPEELNSDRPEEKDLVRHYRTLMFKTDDIAEVEPFRWVKDRNEISALCSLLEGHIYCIALAAHLLRAAGPDGAADCLRELQRRLANTPPDRRTQRVIREAIDSLEKRRAWGGLALKMLERVALFMTPVGMETIDALNDSDGSVFGLPPERKAKLIDDLLESNLLQETLSITDPDTVAYTVHPIVRNFIFEQEHRAFFNSPPSFALPGFTSKTVVVDPGSHDRGVRVVLETINDLEAATERAILDGGRQREAVALCRSMFSVMRARMGSNTTPRWKDYGFYIALIGRLWDLAKKVRPESWDYVEKHDLISVEDPDGPLYADEMAWLYNEVGLASYSEGLMLNALSIWEQGYEINKVIDTEEGGGRYIFQSQINLGAAYIHFGRLNIAEHYLREAKKTNFALEDDDHLGRVFGYLALVKHLQGNLKEADHLYTEALRKLRSEGENIRAECVFMLHHADLKMRLDDSAEAKKLIQQSQYMAEAGYFPDLIAYAQNGMGHWYRSQNEMKNALIQYSASLNESRRIGIRRLESDVLAEESQLYYDLGDPDVARQKATEALKIANEASLGLKQTRGLVALGKATIQAGHQELGICYLKHGRKLAHHQGYFLKKGDAELELRRQGVEPELEDGG